jgi:hypothetical protein
MMLRRILLILAAHDTKSLATASDGPSGLKRTIEVAGGDTGRTTGIGDLHTETSQLD